MQASSRVTSCTCTYTHGHTQKRGHHRSGRPRLDEMQFKIDEPSCLQKWRPGRARHSIAWHVHAVPCNYLQPACPPRIDTPRAKPPEMCPFLPLPALPWTDILVTVPRVRNTHTQNSEPDSQPFHSVPPRRDRTPLFPLADALLPRGLRQPPYTAPFSPSNGHSKGH